MNTLSPSSRPVGPWSARFGRLFLLLGAALVAAGLSGCGGGGGSSEPPPVAAPTLEIRSGLDGAATGPFQVDFVFSGDVAGFSQSSFTLSGGTVASVALALPAGLFTVSGSPVTTSGTLTGTLDT